MDVRKKPVVHRTDGRQVKSWAKKPLWWWHCGTCGENGGGPEWTPILAAAHRHSAQHWPWWP